MGSKIILFHGTFIDLPPYQPSSKSKHELRIRHGALWVSPATGRIEGVDWGVSSDADLKFLLTRKGWKNSDVEVVRADESGNEFFFPGFIGIYPLEPIFQLQIGRAHV